ncbi:MAG: hypothetical protein FJY92_06210 [Candidatus Hydrogenedentes bacterium]|nr:hypothetical protein [Candidatus Hydrogenedentota bacterium]
MPRLLVHVAVLLPLVLSGCMVRSLHPIYTAKDIIAMPEVEGAWKGQDDEGVMSFVRDGDGYVFRIVDGPDRLVASAHFARIGKATYLDLTFPDTSIDEAEKECGDMVESLIAPYVYFTTPVHYFQQVEVRDKVLRMRAMSSGWAKDRRAKGRLWIEHIADGESTLLTPETPRVQRFLRRWETCDDAWESWTEIPLVPADAPTPPK